MFSLQLYIHTPHGVCDGYWDEFTVTARGLILNEAAGQVVATSFPKFFNVGEREGEVADLPFEEFDGSLIITFHHAGSWHVSTKEAFDSEQAVWAQTRFAATLPGTKIS